ncbi:20757_t:CDS:2, partial [Cetraspora pellucida]
MNESNRHILLILDNATSHAIGTLSLTNVEILFLPKNTTSKIQPMDARIITFFKLHYHHLQLQHAIDRDEAGENDIYKVDQLQGMRWAKIAWNEITAHTKIISPRDEFGMPIISESGNGSMEENLVEENVDEENLNEKLIDDIQRQMVALHVCTPMSVKNWLNLEGEEDVHQQFTDEDFVQGAIEVEQGEEEEVVEPSLSPKEKLAILHEALKIVVEMVDDNGITMKSLRKIQTRIREEVQRKKNEKQVQCKLDQFFFK